MDMQVRKKQKVRPATRRQKDAVEQDKKRNRIFEQALQRRRKKVSVTTVYTFTEIQEYLRQKLPKGWTVEVPSPLAEKSLSHYFPDGMPDPKAARDVITGYLQEKGCNEPGDLLDGACEPLALLSRDHALRLIAEGVAPDVIPNRLHDTSVRSLDAEGFRESAALVFARLARNKWVKGPSLWDLPASFGKKLQLKDFLYGTSTLDKHLQMLVHGEHPCACIPMYILAYVFDADELSPADMLVTDFESGQYSVHVVGLVVDRESKALIIADPNGGLVPGSCMEFVSMPPSPRQAPPSTCISRYDLDVLSR